MKTKTTLLGIGLILLGVSNAFASTRKIDCHSPRMEKTFTINNQKVTFHLEKNWKDQLRLPASLDGQMLSTRYTANGLTKTVQFEGHKHIIHIHDKEKFSELEDYIVIRSKEGHEITYPLNCQYK